MFFIKKKLASYYMYVILYCSSVLFLHIGWFQLPVRVSLYTQQQKQGAQRASWYKPYKMPCKWPSFSSLNGFKQLELFLFFFVVDTLSILKLWLSVCVLHLYWKRNMLFLICRLAFSISSLISELDNTQCNEVSTPMIHSSCMQYCSVVMPKFTCTI